MKKFLILSICIIGLAISSQAFGMMEQLEDESVHKEDGHKKESEEACTSKKVDGEKSSLIKLIESAYRPKCLVNINDRGYLLEENHNLKQVGYGIVLTRDLVILDSMGILSHQTLNNLKRLTSTEIRITQWKKDTQHHGNPTLNAELVEQGYAKYTGPLYNVYEPDCLEKLVKSYPTQNETRLTMLLDLCVRVPKGTCDTVFKDLTLWHLDKGCWYIFSQELASELINKKLARPYSSSDYPRKGESIRGDGNSTLAEQYP